MARGRRRAPKRRTGGRTPSRKKMMHGGMHCPPGQTMRGGRCVSSGGGMGNYRKGGRPTRKRRGGGVRKMEHGGSHCGPGMVYQNGGCVPASGGMRSGGRTIQKMRHGGSHGGGGTSGNMMNNTCPPGQHMMPDGTCMMDSDMPSTGGRNNMNRNVSNYQHGGMAGGYCHYGTKTRWSGKVLMQNGIAYGVGPDGVMAGDSPRLGSCDGYV